MRSRQEPFTSNSSDDDDKLEFPFFKVNHNNSSNNHHHHQNNNVSNGSPHHHLHCDDNNPIIYLDLHFHSPQLIRHFHHYQKQHLCDHTLAFLFSRLVFNESTLERANFFDIKLFNQHHGDDDHNDDYESVYPSELPRELNLQMLKQFKLLCARDIKKLTLKYRNDWEIMLTAIGNYTFAVPFASKKLQNDREFVRRSLVVNNQCLHWFPKKFHLDREIALEAVKNLNSCRMITPLFNDKSFVMDAVKVNGCALQFVPGELIDEDVISEALKQNSEASYYIPHHLKRKKVDIDPIDEFLSSPKKKRCSLIDSPYSPTGDLMLSQESSLEDLIEIVRRDGLNIRLLNSECCYDRNIVTEAIKSNGYALKFADSSFKNDKEFVLFALDQPHEKMFKVVEEIDYLGDDIISDREIVLKLVKGAAERWFEVDWKKFNLDMILFDQDFLLSVYKALF